jgi:aspartate kinase
MIVLKFGGSSFRDPDAWKRVLSIIKSRQARNPVIIVSAIAGITDALDRIASEASQGWKQQVQSSFEQITTTHFEVCELLKLNKEVRQNIGMKLRELRLSLESVMTLGELTLRTLDHILAQGELLSSTLLTAYLQRHELRAAFVDSRELICTNDRFSEASPRIALSKTRSRRKLLPLLKQNMIPVLPGFIGATETGLTTTMGRGGSDYSASLFGAWLKVEEIEVWKDVPGFMTADPNVVSDAQTIRHLSYQEAELLCRYGAKILHPLAVRYAARKNLAIRVLYTREPDHPGTIISQSKKDPAPHVIGIAAHKPSGRVTVIGDGLRKPMVAACILNSCGGMEILRVLHNSRRSRMILVMTQEDTDRAIRQIHDGVKSFL